MRVNGVTFVDAEVARLTLDEFVRMNIGVFWQDVPEERRRSRLVSVYGRITGVKSKRGGGR